MAYSNQSEVSNGTLQTILLSIEFFEKEEIHVFLNGAEVFSPASFTWATSNSIQFPAPLVAGTVVLIRRVTDISEMRHIFTAGAQFTNETLDQDYTQILHIAQESIEGGFLEDLFNDLDMHGNRLRNVGDGVLPGDAINVGQAGALISNSPEMLRAVRAPNSDPTMTPLPSVAARANKVMGFDAAGNPVATLPATGSASELALDLATSTVAGKGAGMVGYAGRGVDKWLLENTAHYSHNFGNTLSMLKMALVNPLFQFLGIVTAGDSITWGLGATGTATSSPNTGGLNSARDNSTSNSWVNLLKRWIRNQYLYDNNGGTVSNTNWVTSPSGESTQTSTRRYFLYPRRGNFTFTQDAGASIANTETYNLAAEGTRQVLYMGNGNAGVEISHTISFPFTGKSFTLGFVCQEPTATFYEILINGVSQGFYSTHDGVDGFVDGTYNNYRTHTFPYTVGATVTFRARRNGETGLREIRLQSLRIDKTVRITNQGIIGDATRFYVNNNMGGISTDDYALLTMLGTNDRIWQTTAPGTSNQFVYDLAAYIAAVPANIASHTLMVANPALNEDPAVYSFPMQDVRAVIYQAAKANNLDMVDNYRLFKGLPNSVYTSDGLHPNDLGHAMIFNNFANSLENAGD